MKSLIIRFTVLTVSLIVLTATSCGFSLRGAFDLPPEMQSLVIEGISGNGQIGTELRKSLTFSGGKLVNDRESASAVLNVLEESLDRREISLSNTGKANEFQLTYTLIYEVLNSDGKQVLPRETIEIVRDYFNDQIDVIGKSLEEDQIRAEIYKDAARTLIRRTSVALRRNSG